MDSGSGCRTTHHHILRLKVKTSFRTKGRRRYLWAQYEVHNLYWNIGIHIGSIAQLSLAIGSKAPDRPVALQRDAISASAHGDDSGKIDYRHRRMPLEVGAISKLTGVIFPPGHDCSIHLYSQRVILPCGY